MVFGMVFQDEAMKSAIVKTENIISFSYNPKKSGLKKMIW